jgi:hypothetical protein
MIRIAISEAAFAALSSTLALRAVGYENQTNERGERLVWLEPNVVNRLRAMRGPGESYSDVILRLVEIEGSMTIDLGHRRVTAQIAEAQRMARKRKPTK